MQYCVVLFFVSMFSGDWRVRVNNYIITVINTVARIIRVNHTIAGYFYCKLIGPGFAKRQISFGFFKNKLFFRRRRNPADRYVRQFYFSFNKIGIFFRCYIKNIFKKFLKFFILFFIL